MVVPPARRRAAERVDDGAHQEAAHRVRLGPAERRARRATSRSSSSPSPARSATAARCGSTTCASSRARRRRARRVRRRSAPRPAWRDTNPRAVLDDDPFTTWQSGALAAEQWLQLDFGKPREYGGLVIDWSAQDYAIAYDVEVSDDGQTWTTAYRSTHGNGRRDHVYLPDGESRFIRLALHESSRGQGYAIRALRVIPLELAASPNAVPRRHRQGGTARHLSAVFLRPADVLDRGRRERRREGGAAERRRHAGGREGRLLDPAVPLRRRHAGELEQRAARPGAGGRLPADPVGELAVRLPVAEDHRRRGRPARRLGAAGALSGRQQQRRRRATSTLFLAVRPFQVLPPWQTLNMVGGVSPIHDLVFDDRTLWVNRRKAVVALTPPAHVGATTPDEGAIGDFLVDGVLPERTQVSDPIRLRQRGAGVRPPPAARWPAGGLHRRPVPRSGPVARPTPAASAPRPSSSAPSTPPSATGAGCSAASSSASRPPPPTWCRR